MKFSRNPAGVNFLSGILFPLIFSLLLIVSGSAFLSCSAEKNSRQKIERQLKSLKYKYNIDSEGDFRVYVKTRSGKEAVVGVASAPVKICSRFEIRNIWSVASRIPGSLPENLAESLLYDTWTNLEMGSWALAGKTSEGKNVLLYLTRIPADSPKQVLDNAIKDAAERSSSLNIALKDLEEK